MFVVPVNYGFEWEDELLLYFHSAKEGRKADAFRKDPNVAFELDCGYEVITGDYACRLFRSLSRALWETEQLPFGDAGKKGTGADPSYEACVLPGANLVFRPEMLERCRRLLPPGIVSYR